MRQERRPLLQAPAVQALFVLCISFMLALVANQILGRVAGFVLSPLLFSVLHGVLAALIARWRRMASWWPVMLFFFPIAVLLVNALQLPPVLFLGGFLFLLLLFWSTFRSQVPFYPSGRPVWDAVAGLLPAGRPLRVIDIGSGLGGAVLHLAAQRPDSTFTGIELAPLPWLVSRLRAGLSHSRGNFIRGDYTRLAFADYDVIFAYLSPAAMTALWQKAAAEMRPGSLLLSYEFPIRGVAPDFQVQPQERGPILFGWHMGGKR